MNRAQIRILWLGVIFMVAAGVCPPWIESFQAPGMSHVEKPADYGLIFSPPAVGGTLPSVSPSSPTLKFVSLRVDYGRLFVTWFVIVLITAMINVTLRARIVRSDSSAKELAENESTHLVDGR